MNHFHLEAGLPFDNQGECNLILLSELPNDFSEFKSTFILVNKDPNRFFFINPKGKQEQITVHDHKFFHRKLKEIIDKKKPSVNLEIKLNKERKQAKSLKIPLSLTPSQIKPLISRFGFPFYLIPTCLLAPILLNLNFLHIFAFAKTSKHIYHLFKENKNLVNKKQIIQKIVGEVPYLENIYPQLVKSTFNFFDYGRTLLSAFINYGTTIKYEIVFEGRQLKNFRAIFSRLLDLGNPGAAMHLLIKKMHPELLLTYRSYGGTNIVVEISKNLSKINLDITQDGGINVRLSNEPEFIQSSYQFLADRLFVKVIRITFPEYETIMCENFFTGRPSGLQIADNIISDFYRKRRNPDITEKILHLFVISYACHQLRAVKKIKTMFKGKFFSSDSVLSILAKYCIRYGQVELMKSLFSILGGPAPQRIIANWFYDISISQDIHMLKLLNLYRIKIHNIPQGVEAIRSIGFAGNPYLTLEMLRGEVRLTSMKPDLRHKILLQLRILSLEKVNFLLTKWESELSHSDQQIQLYKKELFNFIVDYITHHHKNEGFIIALIRNRLSKNTVYKSDNPGHVYNNKTLTQIVEEAKLIKVLSFLKGEANSASISSLSSTSFLLNRKRKLENSTSVLILPNSLYQMIGS